jgi:lipopolysaccharide/colanic/teichoic acid biosynthesis glycosyltransferase
MNTSPSTASPFANSIWNETFFAIKEQTRTSVSPSHVLPRDHQSYAANPSKWSLSPFRRALDFLLAALALIVCWPLLAIAALLVRMESEGPVIFRQRRVGRGGELFTVYKFRTMDVTSDQDGPSMTKRGDPRITRIGRLLRKHKLDELPQLVNVLRGEMSLVGPRPRVPLHVGESSLPVRPGLTGAATLVFCCEEEILQTIPDHELEIYNWKMIIPLKAKLDWEYMSQATLATDFALLYKTAARCLSFK